MVTKSQRWMAGMGVMLLVFTLVLVGIDQIVERTDLSISEVRYKGVFERVNPAQVERVVLENLNGNLLTTDIHELEDLIVYLPWVKAAHIKRLWPDTLEITLEELKPVARVNEHRILVASGQLYDNPHDDMDVGLMELTVDESMFEVQKERVFGVLSSVSDLPFEVYQVVFSSRGSVTLMLGFQGLDLEVELGSDEVEKRLQRFSKLWQRDLQRNIGAINKVDMRYENGFVVQARRQKAERG